MEKIKKAVEKARLQGSGATGTSTGEIKREQRTETDIRYSKTRVVDFDEAKLRKNRVVLGTQDSEASAAYKILRTQVEQRLSAKNWNTLAVTSCTSDEGKTLTAVNLAIALAREIQRTVLLVDLDFRNPSVHNVFDLQVQLGLVDYLLEDVPVGEILVNPGIPRLVILPAGRAVQNSSELLSSPRMGELVDELKSRYPSRVIIFDLPPLLSTDDTLAFSPYAETTLLVVEDAKTTRDELSRAVDMLQGVHLLGTVLNKSLESLPTYSRY